MRTLRAEFLNSGSETGELGGEKEKRIGLNGSPRVRQQDGGFRPQGYRADCRGMRSGSPVIADMDAADASIPACRAWIGLVPRRMARMICQQCAQ